MFDWFKKKNNIPQKGIDWNKFQGVWNAERLIDTLCRYKALFGDRMCLDISFAPFGIQNPENNEPERPLKRVWREQINSVFSAYTTYTIDFTYPFDSYSSTFVSRQCSEENLNEVLSILKKHIRVELHPILDMDLLKDHNERTGIFENIFEYLVSIMKQKRFWRGVMGCSKGRACAIRLTEKLFDDNIAKVETVLKHCLLLLMGDNFDKIFTEVELIKNYNYPAITDEELDELDYKWRIENA